MRSHQELLTSSKNIYSQNGEDGIISELFSIIRTTNKYCCEFGAWDGIHFSNTKHLIDNGWSALLIEGDSAKYKELVKNFKQNSKITCSNKFVDDKANSLLEIFKSTKSPTDLDFLSVDIDGLDYYIVKNMGITPRLLCVEVNAGHRPDSAELLPRNTAKNNVGQPLPAFTKLLNNMGYRLVAYNGNAFFVRKDVGFDKELPTIDPKTAYIDFLNHLSREAKDWLYLVNKGWAPPFYKYRNPRLSALSLRVPPSKLKTIWLQQTKNKIKGAARK